MILENRVTLIAMKLNAERCGVGQEVRVYLKCRVSEYQDHRGQGAEAGLNLLQQDKQTVTASLLYFGLLRAVFPDHARSHRNVCRASVEHEGGRRCTDKARAPPGSSPTAVLRSARTPSLLTHHREGSSRFKEKKV